MTIAYPLAPAAPEADVLHPGHFAYRHIGPRREDLAEMLHVVGYGSLDEFIDAVVPEEIRLRRPLALPPGRSEREVLQALRGLAGMNRVFRSYIGLGYAGTFTPQVVQRNVLENPGWYTAYTP
jgi:glycine dehydrogenase